MTRPSPILTALATFATAAALTACSTDTGNQAQSGQSSATTADSAASAAGASAASDAPPFPELGPFDPNLTGAEMPDPCLWATPEFMAKIGHPKFEGTETLTNFRYCFYAPQSAGHPTGHIVGVSFTNFPNGSGGKLNEQEFNGIKIYSVQDDFINFNAFAHIHTQQGGFQVGVSEIGRPQDELEAEAVDILKAFIKEYISVN